MSFRIDINKIGWKGKTSESGILGGGGQIRLFYYKNENRAYAGSFE